jgi:hypothetical protein
MDVCTVEVGLLKKHPCGNASVAHCANCEQPLCSKHAVAQLSASGAKTGKFMCPECDKAAKAYEKSAAAAPKPSAPASRPAEPHKPAEAHRPAAAPAAKKPEPAAEDSGPLEFTPDPKKPADKK